MSEFTTTATTVVGTLIAGGVGATTLELFKPTIHEMGERIKFLFVENTSDILNKTTKKAGEVKEGEKVNLRVINEVLSSSAFATDELIQEYFSGILASSISLNGDNDEAIFYLDIVRSLPAKFLKLHYFIYSILNQKAYLDDSLYTLDTGSSPGLNELIICFDLQELLELQIPIEQAVLALSSKNLISTHNYYSGAKKIHGRRIKELKIYDDLPNLTFFCSPSSLGIELFTSILGRNVETSRFFKNDLKDEFNHNIDLPSSGKLLKLRK